MQLTGRQAVSSPELDECGMIKLGPPQRPKPRTLSYYAMAAFSVAVAIVAAELITRQLHAEAIASSMLCAVIFTAWFGGFGPALVAIALAIIAFHCYLVPPINSFTWKHNVFVLDISELPRLILFLITSVAVSVLVSSQRKTTEALRRSGDDLRMAMEDEKRIEAALLHSELYLTEAQKLSHTGSFGPSPAENFFGQMRYSESSSLTGRRSPVSKLLSNALIRTTALPYNERLTGLPATEMTTSMSIVC